MTENRKRLPGYEVLWYVIGGYQLAFGIFFTIYAYQKLEKRSEFAGFQNILSTELGLVNTLVLLTSSWFAVAAIKFYRINSLIAARYLLGLAMLCGVIFTAIKFVEYNKTLSAGYSLLTNDFFTFYYLLTGLHLMHVWLGTGGLLIAAMFLSRQPAMEDDVLTIESCVVFWHMVDYLWVLIFPLFYLLK